LCGDWEDYEEYREMCYELYRTLAALGLLPEVIMENPCMDYAMVTRMSMDGKEFCVRVGNGTQGGMRKTSSSSGFAVDMPRSRKIHPFLPPA